MIPQPEDRTTTGSLIKSLLAAAALMCALAGVVLYTRAPSGGSVFFLPSRPGDQLPEPQRRQRLAAFNSLGPVSLTIVAHDDLPRALDSMRLPEQALQSLQADLARNLSTGGDVGTAPGTAAAVKAAPAAREKALQLAWVTLWDTDAEDGDTVRIDSQGYSRTVILKKQPITFAIPVPTDGLVKVTGVRDGDGGGITVGLASGGAKAVFPIMSEGQVLGLRVRID